MTRTISTIGFLIVALVVARSDSHGFNDGTLIDGSATGTKSARSFASSSIDVGDFPGSVDGHDEHKGIYSYDEFDHVINKRESDKVRTSRSNNGCQRCKWEDDDYWEKDEEDEIEEDTSDTECNDDDDGQYREHAHGHRHGSQGGTPPGVQKLGSSTRVGQQPAYAGKATGPTNPGTVAKAAISPWSKVSPGSTATYQPQPPTNPKPRPTWDYSDTVTPIGGPSWSSGSPASPNVAAPNPFGAGGSRGPETGSGCSGCAQGLDDAASQKQVPFAGNVQKQSSPGHFPNFINGNVPYSAPGACSGGTGGNCRGNFAGPTGSGSGNRFPEYNSEGQFSASGNGAGFGPQNRNPSAPGSSPTPGTAYNQGFLSGSSTGASGPGNFDSSNRHVPSENVEKPDYPGAKGNPSRGVRPTTSSYAGRPVNAKPEPDSERYPSSTRGFPTAASNPNRGTADKEDSKIFYINVSPAPGSPMGVKPRGKGTSAPHQSQIGSGRPSYQTRPQDDGDTMKPSYQSGPHSGTTRSPYQPGAPGDRDTNKPSYQSAPVSGTSSWPSSPTNNAHPSTTGNIGSGCSSGTSGYKACGPNGPPEGQFDQSSGSFGGPNAKDFSQSSQSVFPKDRLPNGGPSTGYGCVGGTGCTPDKDRNAPTLPGGGGGSYHRNPFLTGKISPPTAGGPHETITTSKPIGQGNLFLQGLQQPGNAGTGTVPGSTGKDNSFSGRPGHPHRGDIGIDESTGPKGSLGGGGGAGFSHDGDDNFAGQPGGNGGPLSGYPGAISGSQAFSYASSSADSHHDAKDPSIGFGQGNAGSWPSNGASAGSLASSGSWASSGASAYASSSASSWAGAGPVSVKG